MLAGGDKGKDGEAVGYACRVSNKLPEDCMKENNAYAPTSILNGWKTADKDIKGGGAAEPAKEGEPKPEGELPAEGEPAAEEATTVNENPEAAEPQAPH